MNKIKMLEHFQGTGVPTLFVGNSYKVPQEVSTGLAEWLVDNGKAQDVTPASKPQPKPEPPKPEPKKESASPPGTLGITTSDDVRTADKFGSKGRKK